MGELMRMKRLEGNKVQMLPKPRIAEQIQFLFGLNGNGMLTSVTCEIVEYEYKDEDTGKIVKKKVKK
jgi:hypothetical protein